MFPQFIFYSILIFFCLLPVQAVEPIPAPQFDDGFSQASDHQDKYINSFAKAKKLLLPLYENHNETFYCNCRFDDSKRINADQCGYLVRKSQTRGSRLEWEHIVPAYRFGKTRQCWKEPTSFDQCVKSNGKKLSGRKCCRKVDETFKEMEADMLNLVPTVGELNGDRRHYAFGLIEGEARRYGACDFEVQTKLKIAEPKPDIRGNIARVYFYFERKYQMALTEEEKTRFTKWHLDDPEDQWEREKRNRVLQTLARFGKTRESSTAFAANE